MQVNVNSIMAHSSWMDNNANNVANVNTEDFNSVQTTLESSSNGNVQAESSQTNTDTDLARELTEQISIEEGTVAQTKAIKAYDEMIGSLIDLSV